MHLSRVQKNKRAAAVILQIVYILARAVALRTGA